MYKSMILCLHNQYFLYCIPKPPRTQIARPPRESCRGLLVFVALLKSADMAEPEGERHSAMPPTSHTSPEPRAAPDTSVSSSTAATSDSLLPNSPARPLQPPTTAEWWSTMPSSDSVHEQKHPPGLEVYSGFNSDVKINSDEAAKEAQPSPPSPPQNFTFGGMDRRDWSEDPTTIDWRSISLRRRGAMPAIEADNIAKGKPGWTRARSPNYSANRSNLPTTSRPVPREGAPEKAGPREAGASEAGATEGIDYGVPTGSNRPVVFFDNLRQLQDLPVTKSATISAATTVIAPATASAALASYLPRDTQAASTDSAHPLSSLQVGSEEANRDSRDNSPGPGFSRRGRIAHRRPENALRPPPQLGRDSTGSTTLSELLLRHGIGPDGEMLPIAPFTGNRHTSSLYEALPPTPQIRPSSLYNSPSPIPYRQRRASSSFDRPVRGRARTPVPWLDRSLLEHEHLRLERSRSASSAPFARHRLSSIPSLPELPPDRSVFEPDIHAFHPSFLTRPIPRANNVIPSVLARSMIRPNNHEQNSMFTDLLSRHLSHHGRHDDHNHTPFRSPSLPRMQIHSSSHSLYEPSLYRPPTPTPTPSFTNTFGDDPRRPQTLRGLYSPVVLFRCNLCVEEDGATTYGSVERVERHLRARHGYGDGWSMGGDRDGSIAGSAVQERHADWHWGIGSDAVDSDAVREMQDMYGVNIRMGPEDEGADGSGHAIFGADHEGHDGGGGEEAQHDADDAGVADDEVPIPGTIVPGTTSTPPRAGDRWYFGRLENEKLRGRQPATATWARRSGSSCDVATQTDMSQAAAEERGAGLYSTTADAAPATGRLVYARMPGSFKASGYVF